MRSVVLVVAMIVAAVAMTPGQAEAAGERQGRYTLSPAEGGGFVRLDTETGQMALCQRRDGDWSCREITGTARGPADELEQLRADNKRLRDELRELEDIALGDKRSPRGAERGGLEFKLPSEQDVDQAMTYVQRMLRKFREKMREIESDQKGAPL